LLAQQQLVKQLGSPRCLLLQEPLLLEVQQLVLVLLLLLQVA
jgi:hypothetical protein